MVAERGSGVPRMRCIPMWHCGWNSLRAAAGGISTGNMFLQHAVTAKLVPCIITSRLHGKGLMHSVGGLFKLDRDRTIHLKCSHTPSRVKDCIAVSFERHARVRCRPLQRLHLTRSHAPQSGKAAQSAGSLWRARGLPKRTRPRRSRTRMAAGS